MYLNCYFSIIVQSLWNSFKEGKNLLLEFTARIVKELSHY